MLSFFLRNMLSKLSQICKALCQLAPNCLHHLIESQNFPHGRVVSFIKPVSHCPCVSKRCFRLLDDIQNFCSSLSQILQFDCINSRNSIAQMSAAWRAAVASAVDCGASLKTHYSLRIIWLPPYWSREELSSVLVCRRSWPPTSTHFELLHPKAGVYLFWAIELY